MDVKGVSWVGDIRQRFEALCQEVDETIYEDTIKYVGTQMRTVGETFKNFYSEVVEDLLPSSPLNSAKEKHDLVTVAHNGDTVVCKKQKIDNTSKSNQVGKEADGACENSQSQFADLISNQSNNVENYFNSRQEQDPLVKSTSDLSSKYSIEEFTCSKSQNERDESLCGCGDIRANEASVVKVSQSNDNEVEFSGDIVEGYASASDAKGSQRKRPSVGGVSTDLDDTMPSMKAVVDTTITNNVENAAEADNEFSVSNPGVDLQGCLKLDESCVLVQKDVHFSKSTLKDVQKSYKKKIREVFSASRWSKHIKDQEQLAGRYEEHSGKTLLNTSTRHPEIKVSETSDTFESEWELL